MDRNRVDILSAEIDSVNFKQALHRCHEFLQDNRQHIVVTPNPEMVMMLIRGSRYPKEVYSPSDSLFHIFHKADLVVPDGVGLLLADKILGKKFNSTHFQERVSGVDLMYALCESVRQQTFRILLVGGAPGVAERAAVRLKTHYQGLDIVGLKESFDGSATYDSELQQRINKYKPDIVFVAFGAGKQERWISRNLSQCPTARIMMGVGGAFDFLVGSKAIGAGVQFGETTRAPRWVQRVWFEWFWRALFAPWRWRRVFRATFDFLWWVLKYRLLMHPVFRPNVLACVYRINDDGKKEVLICSREDDHDHWQMVQGGIDKGETPYRAIEREMKEEIGLVDSNLYSIEQKLKEVFRYRWPFSIRWWQFHRKFLGQEQQLFLVQYFGDPDTIDLRGEYADDDLFYEYQWVDVSAFLESLHPVRRKAASYFLPFLK